MGTRSRSAGPSASARVERAATSGELRRAGGRKPSWPWLMGGVGLAILKAHTFTGLLHHRLGMIALLGLGLAFSVLRLRPVTFTVTAGPLLAFALAPGSTIFGIALGFGAFVLLLVLFIAIGTVLRARQHRDRQDASRVGGTRLSD